MFRFGRAAAYAAAALIVATGATYAAPSVAGEVDAAPLTPEYTVHAFAGPANVESGVSGSFTTAYNPGLDQAVVEHAVAPIAADAPDARNSGVTAQSLATLVSSHSASDVEDAEHDCLAGAVYFESKGEPLLGQLAVAEVILNRAGSGKYPKSVCAVVKQKSQFSFVRGGQIPAIPRSSEAWRKAVAIAHIARENLAEGGVGKAMFFHARYVSPRWRNVTRVASIGNHIFYR